MSEANPMPSPESSDRVDYPGGTVAVIGVLYVLVFAVPELLEAGYTLIAAVVTAVAVVAALVMLRGRLAALRR